MNDTFMKEKPILPLILSMTLPMVLSMLVNSLYNIIDSFFVAQISEEAMTALSLVYPVQNFINAVGIGFGVGINAVIAFHLGAGDHEKADQAATQGLGKGTPSLLISLCRYVVVIIPAAFLLSRFFGAVGVWNAFWITEVISAVISLIIYRKSIAKPVTTARKE